MLQQIFSVPLPFEKAFSHFVQSFANPSLDYFFRIITDLGNPALWALLIAFIYWSGEEKKSFFLAFSLLLAGAIAAVLKPLISRPRPSGTEYRILAEGGGYSFPSGHATVISNVFGYYYEKFEKHSQMIGGLVVLLVMLSRIYLGVHYLLDVVFGGILGFAVGRAVHFFEQNYKKIRISEIRLIEEVGLVTAVLFALAISLAFRPFGEVSGLLGFFAGIFIFKLKGMNSTRVSGINLWAKEIIGFAILGAIGLAGSMFMIKPETYFFGGAWITLIYPALYEGIIRPKPAALCIETSPVASGDDAGAPRSKPITLKKKSKR